MVAVKGTVTVRVDGAPESPQAVQTFSTTVMGIVKGGGEVAPRATQEHCVVVMVVVRVVRPVGQTST